MSETLPSPTNPAPPEIELRPRLRSTRFRQERQAQWKELEDILSRFEARGARGLSEAELISLPRLYRATLSALSVARATSLDQGLTDYLESLSTRAYYAIYGTPERLGERILRFIRHDWPRSVRRLWPETLLSGFILFLGAAVGMILVLADPGWFYNFVPGSLAGERGPDASREQLSDIIYGEHDAQGLSYFAASLWKHNSQVSIFAFALGFAFGVPTLLLMFYNGLILGAFYAVHIDKTLGWEIGGWLIIHGSTEIYAIILAGAAGLHIGRATAFPGRRSRLEAAREHGERAGLVMAGVIIMLLLAGLIEGFLRQLITSDVIRYGFGVTAFALWMLYFYGPRRFGPGGRA